MSEPEPMIWTLPRSPQAAGLARRWLSDALPQMPGEALSEAQLLVTEVVTNALRHGAAPVTMKLRVGATGLRVEVRDDGARLPQQRTASALDTGGRGLQIVDQLATDWGVSRPRAGHGKVVWFEVAIPALVAT